MDSPRSGFRRAAATSWALAGIGIVGMAGASLLAYGRASAETASIEWQRWRSVRDSIAPYATSLGVTVTYDANTAGSEGFSVVGSEAALRRALTSLLDNALAHE